MWTFKSNEQTRTPSECFHVRRNCDQFIGSLSGNFFN